MTPSELLKPAIGAVILVVLGGGYYWSEHRSHSDELDAPANAQVIVTKSTNACFSDLVRVTGFIVPRREAVVVADTEGSKVSDLFVHEGDTITEGQELARLTPLSAAAGSNASRPTISLRAPAPGLLIEVKTLVGAPASPQSGPMFRISINNEVEMDAEVPSVQMLKLNPGATVHISRENTPDITGRVRLVSPEIDRNTQLGHVRVSLPYSPLLKVGMFARADIDAKRSCGVSVPRTAIDHLTLQVVKGNTIETRQVRIGLTSDSSVEILEGFDVGEIVVADAGSSLHDGDKIKTMFAEDLDRTRVR